nr:type VI secretion system tube protein Hcp [uncultured Roseibium sp.]
MAKVDCFLKLDGIKGESQDKTHKDEIDILSWSWGASQSGTTHMGSGSGGGKAHFQDLSLVSYIGKDTSAALQCLATGKHISKGTLYCRKAAGDNPLEYLKIEMEDILVSSFSTGGTGSEDRVTCTWSLNFGSFKVMYTEQKPDGSKGATPEFAFDIAANEKK